MPPISKSLGSLDISKPTTPVMPISKGLGSTGTPYSTGYGDLEATFGSRFNKGLIEGIDSNFTRSRNQKWYDLLGSAMLNTGAEVGLGAGEGVGYLLDIPQWKNILSGTEQEYSNWFSNMMKEAKQYTKDEVAPVYTTDKDQGFQPLNPYWWATNAPSIGSAVSLLIPAFGATRLATKGASAALKVASKTGKVAEKMSDALQASKAFKQFGEGTTSAVFSRYMENTMEASQAGEEAYNKGIEAGLSEAEARKLLGEAASKTWYANSALLATDIIQFNTLFRSANFANKAVDTARKSKLGRLSGIGEQALIEGGEEAYQYVSGKEATRSTLVNNNVLKNDNTTFGQRLAQYVKDGDLWTSAFFGALGGAGFGVVGEKIANDEIGKQKERAQIIEPILKQQTGALLKDNSIFNEGSDNAFVQTALKYAKEGMLSKLSDNLKSHVEDLNKMSDEDLAKNGIVKSEIEGKLKERLDDIAFVEQTYNNLQKFDNAPEVTTGMFLATLNQRFSKRQLDSANTKAEALLNEIGNENKLTNEEIELKRVVLNGDIAKQAKNEALVETLNTKINELVEQVKKLDTTKTNTSIKERLINPKTSLLTEEYTKAYIADKNYKEATDTLNNLQTKDGKVNFVKEVDDLKAKETEKRYNELKNSITANTPEQAIIDIRKYATSLGKENEIDGIVNDIVRKAESSSTPFDPANIATSLSDRYSNNQLLADKELNALAKLMSLPGLDEETLEQQYNSDPRHRDIINKFYTEANSKIVEDQDKIKHNPVPATLNNGPLTVNDPYRDQANDIKPFFLINHQFEMKQIKDGDNSYWLTVYENGSPKPTKKDDSGINWSEVNNPTFGKVGTQVFYEYDGTSAYNKKNSDQYTREILAVIYKDGNTANKLTDNRVVIGTLRAWYKDRNFGDEQGSLRLKELRESINKVIGTSSNQLIETSLYTVVDQKLPGRPWYTGTNNAPHEVIAENEQLLFAIGRTINGKVILDSPNVDSSLITSYDKDVISAGSVYQLVRSANGKLVPIRLYTKKLQETPELLNAAWDTLTKLNPGTFKEQKKKELDPLVYIPNSEINRIENGVLIKYDGKWIPLTKEILGDYMGQVDVKKINKGNYNELISKSGILVTNINPGLHFHSSKFELSYNVHTVGQSTVMKESGKPIATEPAKTNTEQKPTNIATQPLTKLVLGTPKFKLSTSNNKKWNQKEELDWFNSRFPQVDKQVLSDLSEVYKNGGNQAWGMFYNSVVYIQENAGSGVAYHEAFHVAFNMFLNDASRNKMLNEASIRYDIDRNNSSKLEEALADEFSEYIQQKSLDSSLPTQIKDFFKRLYQFIKSLFTDNVNIDELFYRIDQKLYANKKPITQGNSYFTNDVAPKFKLFIDPEKKFSRVKLINTQFFNELDEIKRVVYNDSEMSDIDAIKKRGVHNIYAAIHNQIVEAYNSETDLYKKKELEDLANNFIVKDQDGKIAVIGDYYYSAIRDLSNYGIKISLVADNIEITDAIPDDKIGEINDEENSKEGWEAKSVSISGKETISYEVKKMLRQTPAGTVNNGVFTYDTDDIGFPKFINFDSLYNYLERNIADTYKESEMLDKLDTLIAYKPELDYILNKVKSDDRLRSMFFSNFSKTHTEFLTIKQYQQEDQNFNPELQERPDIITTWRTFSSNRKGVREMILNDWRNNIKDSTRTVYINNGVINTDYTKKLYDEFNSLLTRIKAKYSVDENDTVDLSNILYRAGMDITPEELYSEYTKRFEKIRGMYYEVSPIDSFLALLSGSNSSIDVIINKLATGNNPFEGKDFEFNALNRLINVKSRFSIDTVQSAFINAEGKNVYSHQNPSFLSKTIQSLKSIDTINWYKRDKYYTDSPWLKELADNDEARKEIKYVYFDGLSYDYMDRGVKYTKMSSKNFEIASINAYHNNSKNYGYYRVPTLSDSPTMAFVKFKKYSLDEVIEGLYNVAKSEVSIGKPGLLVIPVTNIENEMQSKQEIAAWMEQEFTKEKERLREIEVLDDSYDLNTNTNTKVDRNMLLKDYFYNNVLGTTQIYQLFMGDVSNYKTADLMAGKRNNEITKPGVKLNTAAIRQNYKSIYLEDVNIDSSKSEFGKSVEAGLKAHGKKQSEISRILAQYQNVNTTDAQAYHTLDRRREILIGLGRWTPRHAKAFNDLKAGRIPDDASIILQPIKPFYYGLHFIESLGKILPIQNKNSEAVLIPAFVNKKDKAGKYLYPKLQSTLKYMEDNGIDSVQFASAVKVGNYGSVPFENILDKAKTQPEIHDLDNDNFVIQQEVPIHHQDDENIFGTQIRKLILGDIDKKKVYFNGLNGEEVVKLFNDATRENVIESYNKIEGRFDDIQELSKLIKDEVRDRKLGENYEVLADIEPTENGKWRFKVPLFYPTQAKRVESLLSSIFKNSVTRQKINGSSLVLVSNFGLSDDLKIVFSKDNKSIDHMEVMLPWWSKEYFPLDANGEFDPSRIDKDILDLVGFRIPTEHLYSIKRMKVKGFTPQEMGGVAILPSEITKISGEDFDIDKLFVMIPHFKVTKGGRIVKIDYDIKTPVNMLSREQRDNMMIDIIKSIWSSNQSFENIVNPGNTNLLQVLRAEIVGDTNAMSLLSLPITQRDIFTKNMTGAGLIGIFANHNVSHAALQHFDLKLRNPVKFGVHKKGQDPVKNKYRSLDPIKNENGSYISRTLASLVSASVDNAKDPILGDLNINTYTADILSLFIRVGVPLDTAIYFINQPIVREYTRKLSNAGGSRAAEVKVFNTLMEGMTKQYKKLTNLDAKVYKGVVNLNKGPLKANLNKKADDPIVILHQMKVLNNLIRYKQEANSLSTLVNATRADSTGSGKNIATNQILLDRISGLLTMENPPIIGIHKIFDADANYSIVSTFTEYGIRKPTQVLSRFFPWLNRTFTRLKEEISYVKQGELTETDVTLINYEVLNFYTSRFFNPQEKQDILYNFPDRLKAYKDSNAGKYRILDSLNVTIPDNIPFKRIEFNNNFSITEEQKDYMTDSWKYMLDTGTEQEIKLANDLIKYVFFTNHFGFNPNSFGHLVPPTHLANMVDEKGNRYADILHNIMSITNGDSYEEHVLDQFMRNNFTKGDIVSQVNQRNYNNVTGITRNSKGVITSFSVNAESVKNKEFVIGKDEDGYRFHAYIQANTNNAMQLFKFVGMLDNVTAVYAIQPRLGIDNFIVEYDLENLALESIIEANKIGDIKVPELMKAQEDTRVVLDDNYDELLEDQVKMSENIAIDFQEDKSPGYRERTIKNASADATIAIAIDFTSAGEILTKKSVENQSKKYIGVDANKLEVTPERVSNIVNALNEANAKTLNIAGNGIYTMKGKYTQEQVDNFTYELLKSVVESPELKNKITSIRSGGQTGFDEAGVKAAKKLGIPAIILAPKGWKFRNEKGTDVYSEEKFKARFGVNSNPQLGLFPTKDDLLNDLIKKCE